MPGATRWRSSSTARPSEMITPSEWEGGSLAMGGLPAQGSALMVLPFEGLAAMKLPTGEIEIVESPEVEALAT